MEEVRRTDRLHLQADAITAERRALRPQLANEKGKCLHCQQYCRGPRSSQPGGISPFLGLAQGSTYELQTQLVVAKQPGFGALDTLNKAELLSNEVSKMLASFIQTLNAGIRTKKLVARG